MSGDTVVDWGVAERIALTVAGDGAPPAGTDRPFGPAAVVETCEAAAGRVARYTMLGGTAGVPTAEAVTRAEWARVALATLRDLAAGVEERLAAGIDLPGPLGSIVRSLAGAAVGAEAGVAVGYAGRRVLGQYDVSLGSERRPPRLLLVEPNLAATHRELGGEPAVFLEWIALHETTHAIQFASVPWLRDHLADQVSSLVGAGAEGLDRRRLAELGRRLVGSDPRKTVRALLHGELARALAGPEQGAALDRIQAAMSLVEGYGEHVMDAADPDRAAAFASLRAQVDARRESRGGLGEVIARLLGMELKLRQYRLGKSFCDAIADREGIATLNRAWSAPEAMPTAEELEAPSLWLERTAAVSAPVSRD